MGWMQTGRKVQQTLKNVGRLRKILGVFVRYGFAGVVEKANLGTFLLERFQGPDVEQLSTAERLRRSFEELGPTFVKLGQLLATRPDLIPEDWCTEFAKLQDSVAPLSFEAVQAVLSSELSESALTSFAHIDPQPLGSASMAQVHQARLQDGTSVVIKVQRPHLEKQIHEDIQVLYFVAELLEENVPELKVFGPKQVVDEFAKAIHLETQFWVEANNIRRFQKNFADDTHIRIPKVFNNLCSDRVLVLEAFHGPRLTQIGRMEHHEAEELLRTILKAYLKMVFQDGLFHGDLHPGNLIRLPDNTLGLIDFGLVGRLNRKTQMGVAQMLLALASEDYERLAFEYIELAPITEHIDMDRYAQDLQSLIAPYYGLSLQKLRLGRLLLRSTTVSAKYGLSLPTELIVFFKSLIAIEGLGQRLFPEFDILETSLEFAKDMVKSPQQTQRLKEELWVLGRESRSLLQQLPRQLHFLIRKMNSPLAVKRVELQGLQDAAFKVSKSIHLLGLSLLICTLLICSTWIALSQAPTSYPPLSVVGFFAALGISLWALLRYFR